MEEITDHFFKGNLFSTVKLHYKQNQCTIDYCSYLNTHSYKFI